ncbi:MAG TPA: OsmC family protein [Thermoplasmata archaeon]|nr:OsmC family protein [Thermoplasmata archaeon]
MQRRASAVWRGGLKDGKGTVSTASGALKGIAYSFAMRFENEPGTNPEELVAAAHAACFSMALSSELGKSGYRPESIETKATLDFDKTDAGFSVKSIHLEVSAKVPSADSAKFQTAAEAAKKTCPISRLLNTQISMSARLS